MNISLPDALKSFIDAQILHRGYGTNSEYVRELLRKEQDRVQLRGLLLEGADSKPEAPANEEYFQRLRQNIQEHE